MVEENNPPDWHWSAAERRWRWWDGAAWTDHYHHAPVKPGKAPKSRQQNRTSLNRRLLFLVVVLVGAWVVSLLYPWMVGL